MYSLLYFCIVCMIHIHLTTVHFHHNVRIHMQLLCYALFFIIHTIEGAYLRILNGVEGGGVGSLEWFYNLLTLCFLSTLELSSVNILSYLNVCVGGWGGGGSAQGRAYAWETHLWLSHMISSTTSAAFCYLSL